MGSQYDNILYDTQMLKDLAAFVSNHADKVSGGTAPRVSSESIRFLIYSGFTKSEILSWCNDNSNVDFSYVVNQLNALFASARNPRRSTSNIAYRKKSMETSGFNKSLWSVELIFYVSVIYLNFSARQMKKDDWEALAVLFDAKYPTDIVVTLLLNDVPFSTMARMASNGGDGEMLLSMNSSMVV